MNKLLDLPEALEAAGLTVRVLDEWDTPWYKLKANQRIRTVGVPNGEDPDDYLLYGWREPDGNPAGMMWHHTAGREYTPNPEKANLYTGIGYAGTDRLYEEDYGDGFPVVVVANAWPAPVSSGYGVRDVLEQFVKQDIPFNGRQTQPDDKPWAGNTHYINLENVLRGLGQKMEDEVWEMLPVIARVINDLMGWGAARHVAHAHHTGRKIDMRDGRYANADETVQALRKEMIMVTDCPWTNHRYPPCENHYFPDLGLPTGTGEGENQGQCNTPDDQKPAADWAFGPEGRFDAGNRYRYDYGTLLTEGREMVFEYRDWKKENAS